jgi:hypothetical protein
VGPECLLTSGDAAGARRAYSDGGQRRLIPAAGDGIARRRWRYADTWEGGLCGLGLGRVGGGGNQVKGQGHGGAENYCYRVLESQQNLSAFFF